jgi:synaptotagmin-like protein
MDYQGNREVYDLPKQPSPSPRRILRQTTLPNPDSNIGYGNNQNLTLPVSPKNLLSPQYSPYHMSDNEAENDNDMQQPIPTAHHGRYPMRRQSTMPCKPNEGYASQKYLSTSPNRSIYMRSPDKNEDPPSQQQTRYPPFVRQSTFPSNTTNDQYHRQLPTSPNRMLFNKSPDSGGESDPPKIRFLRQATLPNPDQHMKFLPPSPSKMQLSPQIHKRSPEFVRQNTLPAPDMNTLSVHPPGAKFLPISPRQKQNFLFPHPTPVPRPFLSQQHMPTVDDVITPRAASPLAGIQREHAAKMIKVRSHSNEEYTFSRPYQTEGRRLLPEIPPNRSPR